MEILSSIINWLFIETIYGIVLICGVVYFLVKGIKKLIPAFPSPEILASLAFFIGIFTLPSIPRYQFEKEAFLQIEAGKDWVMVVNKTKLSSIIEPLGPERSWKMAKPKDVVS